ncbi:hypothetical protein [Bradyrhizobium liaoningense]
MPLPLTSETLAAAYDYLKTTPPFRGWNMPESDEVKFIVAKFRDDFAQYRWDGKQHTVSVSVNAVGQTSTLIEKMAHEMIHLHLEDSKMETRGTKNTHSIWFRKFAAQVCRIHGFDGKAFY